MILVPLDLREGILGRWSVDLPSRSRSESDDAIEDWLESGLVAADESFREGSAMDGSGRAATVAMVDAGSSWSPKERWMLR